MFAFFVFILSGAAIAILLLAKRFEMKGRQLFLLRGLSQGDERARDLYHRTLHLYSEGKVKFVFLVQKQLPARVKMYINKGSVWVRERGEERFGNMRNSRLLKRPDGISEFIKSISEVEKGGELHDDVYVEPTLDEQPLAYRITPVAKPSKPRAPRKPRAKKIPVAETLD